MDGQLWAMLLDPNCSPICEVEIIASATEICAGESVDLTVENCSETDDINGFTFKGTFQGSNYYLSTTSQDYSVP